MVTESKTLKTITVGIDEDNPDWSLCPGHVDAKTFNDAHAAEGWQGDPVEEDDLSHEYFTVENGIYKSVTKDAPGALPFTVMAWN